MTGRYKAYSEYKDSGVKFAPKIPSHWTVSKVNYISTFGRGLSITKANLEDEGIPCVSYGEVHSKYGFEVDPNKHSLKCVNPAYLETSAFALLSKGDFVFADTSEDIEGSGNFTQLVCDETLLAGYHTIVVRPDISNYYRFIAYLFDSNEFRTQIRDAVKGVKVFSITQAILKNANVWLPEYEEQQKIANFLDHETAKIDTLITKQEKLIELLKEKRQAVISHAVTKGLNPDAPMKDSGVEWLGEVPEHWAVGRYKFNTKRIIVGIAEAATHAYSDSGVPLIRSTNIKDNCELSGEFLYLKEEFADSNCSKSLHTNDVVTVRTGYPGVSAVVPSCLDRSQCFTNLVATPNDNNRSYFLANFLNSHLGKAYFKLQGWGSAQQNISVPILQNTPFVTPPIEEQDEICAYVLSQRKKFEQLISDVEKSKKLLIERKTALISAAVTGKIDVRDWQGEA
ncbi:restriction endonuclease subunit S [Vibrio sp. Y42_MX_L11]|uniref:restriction endonuclease subunit S n=1 Tax=Vibrio sp. Y42_MX_L11 TaxID=2957765 RepID=UPI0020A42956|nr:restriction endonuclease subunit S [Vibrio sp. Y42_MX_L11]